MADQYLRKVSLEVGRADGSGLDLSELRIRFSVTRGDIRTPHHATIRVTNLSRDTVKQIKAEFTQVQLQAGYQDAYGMIFAGQIVQKREGRESPVDTYLDLICADGDEAYNFAVINTTLAAGWTYQDVYAALLTALKPFGITAGYAPEFPATKGPRGKVMFGMVRDHLQALAQSAACSWFILDGKLDLVPLYSFVPGTAVVLTRKTGLIGLPQKTLNGGIVARCLLNSDIRPGRVVQLDNASIQDAEISVDFTAINFVPQTDEDGFYRVLCVNHSGDNRGQDWYSEIICLARDDPGPPNGSLIGFTNG